MEGSKWRRGINIEMRRQLNGKTSPAEKWETVKLNAASLHNPKFHQVVCHKCVFHGVCISDILRIIVWGVRTHYLYLCHCQRLPPSINLLWLTATFCDNLFCDHPLKMAFCILMFCTHFFFFSIVYYYYQYHNHFPYNITDIIRSKE